MRKAIIVGSGIGGLASGLRLAVKGYQVDIFELESHAGGKLSQFSNGGFRFDFGPSLFTMPQLVDELFQVAGEDPRDHFNYEKLELACRYFYNDSTVLNAFTDLDRFAHEVEDVLSVPAQRVKSYLNRSGAMNTYTSPIFLENSLHKASTYLNTNALKALVRLPGYDLGTTMHAANQKRLQHPKLVQLFDRFATYNGSDPYQAPGILNIIPSLEHLDGAYFPEGGMYAITQAVVGLCERHGVRIHLEQRVEEITIQNKTATGVVVNGKEHRADVVVSNMDVYHAYKQLLPSQKPPKRILEQERSSSALVFYWGINRAFDQLDVHNIFFSADYQNEFETMFKRKDICDDPTVYINISSKKCPSDAPEGCENWFVMINAPYDSGQDWEAVTKRTRCNVLGKLSRLLGADIEHHIVTEDITDPRRIALQTLSHKGALYGSSSNSKMAAFLRHPNFSSSIENLFFCGGSVHPGGGIPLCLYSARIVDQLTD